MSAQLYALYINKMIFWRHGESACAWMIIVLVPALHFCKAPPEVYLPVYAGILSSLLLCDFLRVKHRNAAKRVFEKEYN